MVQSIFLEGFWRTDFIISIVGCFLLSTLYLWMPYGESSWNGFVGNPSGNSHHSNTSILDLLKPQALKCIALKSSLLLGESKRIVSVISWDRTFFVPLTVVGNALEPSSSEEDLNPSGHWYHLDGIKRSSSGDIRESNSGSRGKQPGFIRSWVENVGSGGS